MDIFDNCRICLQSITHQPIKIPRNLSKFIEETLFALFVVMRRNNKLTNVNLCAVCFNKLNEIQDFHEQIREADDFWQTQFEQQPEQTENIPEPEPPKNESNLVEETEESPEEVEVPEVPTKTIEEDQYKPVEPYKQISLLINPKKSATKSPPSVVETERDEMQFPNDDTQINLDWATNEDPSVILANDNSPEQKYVTDHGIIEFEYEMRADETPLLEVEGGSDTLETDTINLLDNRVIMTESDDDIFIHEYGIDDDTISNSDNSATMAIREPVQSAYIVQILDENGIVRKAYRCPECDRNFDRHTDLQSHRLRHTDIKPFKCDICGKSFRQKNILTTHQALHFGKKVECPECGKKFARRSQLILHTRMHRDEKPFPCLFEGCGISFRQKQHLIDHTFIHTGEKQFLCSWCSKAFQTRKRLQDHLYKVHSQHRYSCDMCDKLFLKPHMLRNHFSSAHKVEVFDVSHLKTTIELNKRPKKNASSQKYQIK